METMDDKSSAQSKEGDVCTDDKSPVKVDAPVQEVKEDAAVETEEKERKRSLPDDDASSSDVPEKRAKLDPSTNEDPSSEDKTSDSKSEDQDNKGDNKKIEKTSLVDKDKNVDSKSNSKEEKSLPSDSEKTDVPYLNGGDDVSSTKSGSDSEKENRSQEKENRNRDSSEVNRKPKSDVITLSDESDEESCKTMADIVDEITPEEIKLRRKIIKRLQGELRNEEAKLVLLKKLRQSQLSHQIQDGGLERPKGSTVQHPGAPPPLVRGQQGSVAGKLPQSSHNGHHSQSLSHPNRSSQGQNRQSGHGPPPLVNMAPKMSNHQTLSQHHNMNRNLMSSQQGHRGNMSHMMPGYRQNHVQPSPQHLAAAQRQEEQTPAQRQAAAKLALRKQLEKTLLQIPPPKPPPPEMNFIPSLASPDFIILLGLEEVVNFIIDSQLIARGQKNPDEKFVCNPFSCVQCGADFTPVWKREKPGSRNVICEHCVTSNQKKALKQEHTNRLKSAFVKALQQEQEIERMQAQSLTQTASSPQTHPVVATTTASLPAAASPMSGISSSSVMNLTSYKPSPEQLRQHQNFIQAHQAQLRATSTLGLPFVQRGPFPYQLPFTKPSDIQRQYFLDLLPRGGNMSWKS